MSFSPLSSKVCKAAASLHQEAFSPGWRENDFRSFLEDPLIHGVTYEKNHHLLGYILWREVLDEAEILTLVVSPLSRRKGIGRALLTHLMEELPRKGIYRLFLEVAEDNPAGIQLYTQHNFVLLGKRPHYYPRKSGKTIPALTFVKDLV